MTDTPPWKYHNGSFFLFFIFLPKKLENVGWEECDFIQLNFFFHRKKISTLDIICTLFFSFLPRSLAHWCLIDLNETRSEGSINTKNNVITFFGRRKKWTFLHLTTTWHSIGFGKCRLKKIRQKYQEIVGVKNFELLINSTRFFMANRVLGKNSRFYRLQLYNVD